MAGLWSPPVVEEPSSSTGMLAACMRNDQRLPPIDPDSPLPKCHLYLLNHVCCSYSQDVVGWRLFNMTPVV